MEGTDRDVIQVAVPADKKYSGRLLLLTLRPKLRTHIQHTHKYIYIYIFVCADDQLLIAQDYEDLEYMTRKLIDEYELWGLKIMLKKLNIWP